MKKTTIAALSAVLLLLLVGEPLRCAAAETNSSPGTAELQAEIIKLQESLKAGKNTEAGLSGALGRLDALHTKYKAIDKEAAAGALLIKGEVYLQVLENDTKGEEILSAVTKDYADTEAGKVATHLQATMKATSAARSIQRSLVPGAVFSDFDEKDLAGNPLSVAKYKGKVVLVDFWATWCGPCRMELPNVIATYEKNHAKGFEIVGISLDTDKGRLESFIKANKMEWPQYFDGLGWGNKLSGKYGVQSIPATFLIGRDGKIIAKNLRGEELAAAVEKALATK